MKMIRFALGDFSVAQTALRTLAQSGQRSGAILDVARETLRALRQSSQVVPAHLPTPSRIEGLLGSENRSLVGDALGHVDAWITWRLRSETRTVTPRRMGMIDPQPASSRFWGLAAMGSAGGTPRGPVLPLEGVSMTAAGDLVRSGKISKGTIAALDKILYERDPHLILSEAGYRFWTGIMSNVAAVYKEKIGKGGKINQNAVAEIAIHLGFLSPDDAHQLHRMVDLLEGTLALEDEPLERLIEVGEVPSEVQGVWTPRELNQLTTSWEQSLANYVTEQDRFESGGLFGRNLQGRGRFLIRYFGWYTRFRPDLSSDLDRSFAHGILKKLNSQYWEADPVRQVSYFDRKLCQMRLIARGTEKKKGEPSGYMERPWPAELVHPFMRAGEGARPGRLERPDILHRLLRRLFGRYYYLTRFTPRVSSQRIERIIAAALELGMLLPEEKVAASDLFLRLREYLLSHEGEWRTQAASRFQEGSPEVELHQVLSQADGPLPRADQGQEVVAKTATGGAEGRQAEHRERNAWTRELDQAAEAGARYRPFATALLGYKPPKKSTTPFPAVTASIEVEERPAEEDQPVDSSQPETIPRAELVVEVTPREEPPQAAKTFADELAEWIESEEIRASAPEDPEERQWIIKLLGGLIEEAIHPEFANPVPIPERLKGLLERRVRSREVKPEAVEPLTAWAQAAFDRLVERGRIDLSTIRIESGWHGIAPRGWEKGQAGFIPLEDLQELGRTTEEINAVSLSHISAAPGTARDWERTQRQVINVFCAYRSLGGRVDEVDEVLLDRVATDFARPFRASTRALAEHWKGYALRLMDSIRGGMPKRKLVSPLLSLEELRERNQRDYDRAVEIFQEEAAARHEDFSLDKKTSRRQLSILLNLRHFYGEEGGSPLNLDHDLARRVLDRLLADRPDEARASSAAYYLPLLQKLIEKEAALLQERQQAREAKAAVRAAAVARPEGKQPRASRSIAEQLAGVRLPEPAEEPWAPAPVSEPLPPTEVVPLAMSAPVVREETPGPVSHEETVVAVLPGERPPLPEEPPADSPVKIAVGRWVGEEGYRILPTNPAVQDCTVRIVTDLLEAALLPQEAGQGAIDSRLKRVAGSQAASGRLGRVEVQRMADLAHQVYQWAVSQGLVEERPAGVITQAPEDETEVRRSLARVKSLLQEGRLTQEAVHQAGRVLSEDFARQEIIFPKQQFEGLRRLLLNAFCTYVTRGGSIENPDRPLMRRVANFFARRGKAVNTRRHAQQLYRNLVNLVERIRFSVPLPLERERTLFPMHSVRFLREKNYVSLRQYVFAVRVVREEVLNRGLMPLRWALVSEIQLLLNLRYHYEAASGNLETVDPNIADEIIAHYIPYPTYLPLRDILQHYRGLLQSLLNLERRYPEDEPPSTVSTDSPLRLAMLEFVSTRFDADPMKALGTLSRIYATYFSLRDFTPEINSRRLDLILEGQTGENHLSLVEVTRYRQAFLDFVQFLQGHPSQSRAETTKEG